MHVTGVDFTIVPITDFERSKQFYGEVLGLEESKQWGEMPAQEFETGNLTIAIMQPDAFGQEFSPNNFPIALRVDDVGRSPRRARGQRRRVLRRHPRLRRLPHGLLQRP